MFIDCVILCDMQAGYQDGLNADCMWMDRHLLTWGPMKMHDNYQEEEEHVWKNKNYEARQEQKYFCDRLFLLDVRVSFHGSDVLAWRNMR